MLNHVVLGNVVLYPLAQPVAFQHSFAPWLQLLALVNDEPVTVKIVVLGFVVKYPLAQPVAHVAVTLPQLELPA